MNKTFQPMTQASMQQKQQRGGFTLVEILVAVAILAVMLTVILVPLRMGFQSFQIGKSRGDVQQQAQLMLGQIANDFRKSQFVFANSYIPGISDSKDTSSPCSSAAYKPAASWEYRPYVISRDTTATGSPFSGGYGVCTNTGVQGWNNLSRIDMLQIRRDSNGKPANSSAGQDFIISYYPRRLDLTKPFDVIDNPIVLFRAQIPYRERDAAGNPGPTFKDGSNFNAMIDWTQYPNNVGSCAPATRPAETNRSFEWITHNYFGEADLQPLTADTINGTVVPGAHTLVTPRDMSLVAPRAGSGEQESYVPDLTFTEESTDGKRIDRITVSLTLAQYDSTGLGQTNGQASAQRVRVSQTFNLPNVACGP